MPKGNKVKTHKGAKDRFFRTNGGKGRLRRRQANRNHILEKKSSRRKRRLKDEIDVDAADTGRIGKLVPRGN